MFSAGTLETTPRVNKPIPRLAYEISIVPEVELLVIRPSLGLENTWQTGEQEAH